MNYDYNYYAEQAILATEVLTQKAINSAAFDKTVIGTITAQEEDGYWVTHNNIRFKVITSDSYKVGDQVFVTIPQGDYSLDKVITGKYSSSDNSVKLTYNDPMKQFVSSRKLELSPNLSFITKNSNTILTKSVSYQISPFDYDNSKTFDYIGLQLYLDLDLTLEQNQSVYAVSINFLHEFGSTNPNDKRISITSREFLGNPHYANSSIPYEVIIPYPSGLIPTKIEGVEINFFYDDNCGASNKDQIIRLNKLNILFGYDQKSISETNASFLSVNENEKITYGYADSIKTRNLNLEWIYLNDDDEKIIYNKYHPIKSGTYDQMIYDIEVVKNQNYTSEDAKNEAIEEVLEKYDEEFKDYTIYWVRYNDGSGDNVTEELKDLDLFNWQTIATGTTMNQQITLITNYSKDQYKAVIRYKTNRQAYLEKLENEKKKPEEKDWYEYSVSSAFIFTSEEPKPEVGAASSSGNSLKLTINENATGIFNYYGIDNKIVDDTFKGPYTVTASFFDGLEWDTTIGEATSNIRTVEWTYSTANTMIVVGDNPVNSNKNIFTFSINPVYTFESTNNKIECKVVMTNGEVRQGSLGLQFGDAKSSGTTYSFNIDFLNGINCLYLSSTSPEAEVKATFTKNNGETIPVPNISWQLLNDFEDSFELEEDSGEIVKLRYKGPKIPTDAGIIYNPAQYPTIENQLANYVILEAKISNYNVANDLASDFIAYLPIPLVQDEKYTSVAGATRVVYDTMGTTASYSNLAYALYEGNNVVPDIQWRLIHPHNENNGIPKITTRSEKGQIGYFLQPVTYTPRELPAVCLVAEKQTDTTTITDPETGETEEVKIYTPVWIQPLLITKNSWNSELINEWDETVSINKEKGSILSPTFIAGRKDTNNLFTGVVLGDVTNAGIERAAGLYGFQKGDQRFYFTENGEAYIGTGPGHELSINKDGDMIISMRDFTLEADHIYLTSIDQPRLEFYSDAERLDVNKRVVVGKISNKDTYGIDIYNGAFRMYAQPYKQGLTDQDASLWFDTREEIGMAMFFNGILERKASSQVNYVYEWTDASGNVNKENAYYSNVVTTTLGETSAFKMKFDTNDSNVVENWFSGISIKSKFTNTGANVANSTFSWGYLGGKSVGYYTTLNQAPPMILAAESDEDPVLYILALPANNAATVNPNRISTIHIQATGHEKARAVVSTDGLNAVTQSQGAGATFWGQKWIDTDDKTNYSNYIHLYSLGSTSYIKLESPSIQLAGTVQIAPQLNVNTVGNHIDSHIGFKASLIPHEKTGNDRVLGTANYRWKNAYLSNGPNTESDRRIKKDIQPLSQKYKNLFLKLLPVSYKFKYPTSDRTHIGFVSQEVEEAMKEVGLTDLEFGGFCKDIETTFIIDENGNRKEVQNLDENGNVQYFYSLRYEEFIGIITAVLQDTTYEVEELKQRLDRLEAKL